jgi:hypothetical protein
MNALFPKYKELRTITRKYKHIYLNSVGKQKMVHICILFTQKMLFSDSFK